MNALLLRCRYIFAPVTLFLIFVLGFVAAGPISAKAQQTTSTEPLWASHSLHLQFSGEQPSPLAMVNGDFDEDGVNDLVIGYALAKGGSIAVLRGNLDAHAPQTHESWLAAGQHEYSDPYLQNSEPISVDSRPSLMTAADVNGDGHLDLVFATKGGSQLFAMFGDGKGNFLSPVSTTVDGGVTVLAAYRPGVPFMGEVVLLGQQSNQGAKLSILSYSSNTWTTQASYPLPGRATAMTVANLDTDSIPDTAIVAGGQLLILHGKAALSGQNALTTVPGSDVESVTAGSFLFDRHGLLQLSVLTSSGDVVTLAHEGFDSRPYTTQELAQSRRSQRSRKNQQVPIQQASNPVDEPWIEVERRSGVAPHSSSDMAPILLRSRFSGSGTDDLVVLNSSQQQRTLIRQAPSGASSSSSQLASTLMSFSKAAVSSPSSVSSSSLAPGNIVAAISAPVSPDTRQGLVMLSANSLSPEVSFATTGNTYYVNSTADNTGTSTDPSDGMRCTQGSAERCTLRDAISFANGDAPSNISGGKSDIIMLPAGTYVLSQQAGSFDSNENALTHLEILGPMSIVGASASSTIIDGGANDEVFTINGGVYSSAVLNPSGTSYVFDVVLNNLTIQNGKNVNSDGTNSVGGCINWDAFGNGSLTITNSVIKNCNDSNGDGGAIYAESSDSGTGTLTLDQDQIESSSSSLNGVVALDFDPSLPNLSATNTAFSQNSAGAGGGLFISEPSAGSTCPTITLTNVIISNNQATGGGNGGGIETSCGIVVGASTFDSNSTSGGLGGGLHVNAPGTTTTITDSNFQANSAATGGAISVDNDFEGQSSTLQISLSRIVGNTATNGGGISGGDQASPSGSGAGKITAKDNWWGCNSGPNSTGCDTTAQFNAGSSDTLTTSPYAVLTLSASPNAVSQGSTSILTAGITTDSFGAAITGAFPSVQNLTPTYSTTSTGDSITGGQPLSSAGVSTATLNASGALGSYKASAKVDNATARVNYAVTDIATTLAMTASPITFGNTPIISVALTVSSSSPAPTGLSAANFTANIDGVSNPLTISGLTTQNTFTLTGSALSSLNAGNHTINVNFSGVSGYSASLASATLVVNKAPATVMLNIPTATYDGTAHAVTATTSPGGLAVSITYSGSTTVPTNAGTYNVAGTINDTNYAGNASGQLVINKATLNLAWTPTSPIVYGTPLSPAQLNATATFNGTPESGTFSYSSAIGTVLDAGTHTLTVSFTPSNTTDFSAPTPITANITVTQAAPILAWTPTSPIVYGTPLSLAQLNATATHNGTPIAGTFSYSSAIGTVLTAGMHTLTVSFTPSNTTDFSAPTPITANITVTQAAPILAWTPTSPIVYGTPLSLAQLNATATHNGTPIAGTFSYSSAIGTVLTAGMHTLTVSFTPSDTTDYSTSAPITANITVNPATPVISWSPSSPIVYGTALSAAQLNATATNNGSAVAGIFSYSPALGTVLTAGTHTLTVTFSPSDTTDYNMPVPLTKNITVSQGTPALAWSQPSSIVSGTALSAAQLNATASYNSTPVAGTFSYNPALGTVLSAGTHTLTGTFTPSDTTDYSTPAPITTNITILAIPVLAWSPTSPIVYGTSLSPAQFNATATFNGNPIAGTFSYSSTLGTVLGVGTHTLTVTFTPSDTTTYSKPAAITTNIAVIPATPVISWSPSSPIVYGTALSAAQLNATAAYNGTAVAGTFSYSPAVGTVLTAGPHTLTVTFTPSDTTTYNAPAPTTTNITVTQDTPVLAWSQPSPIVSGTALSAIQLNATASYNGSAVAGTFSYNPALGTVLTAGTHTLTATFTPSDTTDYGIPAPITTNITIQAVPILAWSPSSPIVYGTPLSPAQFNATAAYNGNPVAGTFSYSSAIGTVLGVGTHTLTVTFTPSDTTTYSTPAPATANVMVIPATPMLTWTAPASVTYGSALTSTQLNATATYNGNQVQGVFTYATGSGTVLSVGMHTLTATFTPSDTTDYNTPTGTVSTTITVTPATPMLQWATPASITYGSALTRAQLSASATNLGNPVSGTFNYTPGLGTVLTVGSHTLSATFIPNDTTDYKTPTGYVRTMITVTPATPMLQWATPASITYGTTLTNSQLNATASYNGSRVSGSFTYTPAPGTVLTVGSHTLSATFIPSDTADYNSPTGTVSTTITVTAATPMLQWATPASIPYGTALTNSQLNATASYNGNQVSGSFTYTPAMGTVLSAGSHTLSVVFTPADTTTYGTPAPITTNLIVSQNKLTITANNATRVYGTANPVFTGAITGELPVDSFTESFATPATFDSPVNSYPITPGVTGSNLTNYAVAAQSGVLTVTPAGTTVALSTTSTTANAAANVTLTATVLSATTGVPTGSVQFLDGSTVLGYGMLGAQGVGTYTTSSLASGVHQITAVYAGDTNFTGSSSSQSTVTIGSPGYTLLANPASLTLRAGQTGKVSLTFTPVGGFTGTVSLSCTGLPAGANCSFAPSNLTADGSNKQQIAQLTITTLGSTQGTVSMNRRDGSSSGPLRASMFLLPGMFFGGFLMWQRKKLRVRNGQLLMLLILVASLTSMVGCGTSSPTTTLGSSSVLVTATASAEGSGTSNASAAFTLTIVE